MRKLDLFKNTMVKYGVKEAMVDSKIKGVCSEIFGIKQSINMEMIGCTAKFFSIQFVARKS